MHIQDTLAWPSGDCKPIIATRLEPAQLAAASDAFVFRHRDDLDWFEGAWFQVEGLGAVLLMKHEGSPLGLTVLYVDLACDTNVARRLLADYFGLSKESIAWRREVA